MPDPQDFLQRLRQQQQSQPLEMPEYDLPSQIPSVQVDPVQQVFGDGRTTKQAPKSPVLKRRLPEGSPFETYGDVQDWNPSAPIQDLKQLGGLLKLRRQLNDPATFRSQLAKRKKPQQQQPPVTAEGAFGRSVPGQPGSYYPADTSARVNPFDLNQPSEAEQMGNRALVGAGESAQLPQARTLFDRIRNEQARDAAYRSPKQTQLRLEGVDTGQTKLNLPPSSLQQLEGIDTGETQIDPAALQRVQRDKLEKRDGRFVAGLLNPAAQLANTFADAGITAPREMSESFFPTLTKGLAGIPEGFARIGDKILNVGSLAQTNAIRKIAEMHPEWSPEEKVAAANQIQELEGNLSNAGDYFEKGLTKPVAAAADYLYPDDSPVEKSINPLKRGFWTRTMPEAGASMLPFVAASGVSAGLGLAPELVAGLSGAAMEVPDQYHEARAAGATPEQLARTVDAAGAAGALEAFGADSLLGKFGLKGKSLPGYVLKEGVQESAQEGAQQGVEDLGSKYYSKINPKLAWSQIGENMLRGAVPAFFLGVGGGVVSSGSRHQEAAQQIEQLAATEPDHPIVQVIAQAGIDPATISQADDRAMDELSKRLQAMAKMNSQVQQLQGTREVLRQQVQNAQDAQMMGRVPSTVEQSQIQQLPAVEQELVVAEQGQAALVQDLQENVSPLFQNLAKAIGQKDVQPLTDVKEDPRLDLVKEVRKAGGFDASPGAIESGELERLSPKELQSTGLIRREGGVKPDTLRQDMVSEGLSNAETPSEFIDEVESAARREKTDGESYSDYQRSKMTPEELKDNDQLEKVLKDRAHPFTRMYRTLESPKTIYTKELARKFVQEADKLGFSDDFIERTLIEAQQRGGMGATVETPVAETSPRPVKSSGEPGKSISLSPYKVLEVNNRDLLKELYNTNLNSKEGKEGIQALREYADEKGIEQRHVDAHISDIQNWQKKYGVPKSQPSAKPKLLLKLQPKIEEAAPASSLGFNPDQRKLLGRDHTNILDSEFDEYMGQVEELQNLSVRGKEHGGFDISEAERKGLVSKILEIRQERRKRVKAGRLQALSGSHTKPTETKAKLGKELVEQSQNETGIDQAAHEAATSPKNDLPEPTEAQKEAGNYKKGHISIHGLDVTIENPKGSIRSGVNANGKSWEVEMSAHYGYIKRTVGADEEQIDVYIGPGGENTDKVFVVDQVDAKTGQFDEHKVILGAADKRSAEVLYDAHFDDGKGPDRRGAVTEMSVEQFKDWLKTEDNTKPIAPTSKVPLEPSKTEAPKVEVSASKKTDSGLVPLPKVGDVKMSEGRAYTLERVQRLGQGENVLDFELWSSEVGWTMLTRDAESGEALPGSIITDTNEDRIKRRFRNKTEEYRFSSNKNASVEVADLSGGKVGENGAEAESGETVERGDAETVSPGASFKEATGNERFTDSGGPDESGLFADTRTSLDTGTKPAPESENKPKGKRKPGSSSSESTGKRKSGSKAAPSLFDNETSATDESIRVEGDTGLAGMAITAKSATRLQAAYDPELDASPSSLPPAARRTRESVENSPEFKRWFGKSKVVDADGNPVPVYHGTQSPVEIGEVNPEKFDSDGLYGPGFYTTQSSDVAAGEGGYALTKGHRENMPVEGNPHAYKLYLRIEKPFDIDAQYDEEQQKRIFGVPVSRDSMSGQAIYKYVVAQQSSKKGANAFLAKNGFDGITHLGGKLQGTTKEFGFARLRAEEYAKEVGGTVSRDPDTGEYEVKDHRVWIAFEPNQVKSVFNRGTFDDSANLSTARRNPTGPASELTNPLDVFLHAETLLKSRGSRGVRMYVNDHARAILGASLTEVFGTDYTNVSSINLSRSEVKQIADYLEGSLSELEATHQPGAKQFIADLREMLAKGKNQRTFNIVDVTPFEQRHATGLRGDKDRATEAFKGDVREETFHWSQREIDGDSIALVGSSWAQSSKGYGKYRKALIKLGYPDDAETIAAETAAKIAAGKFEDLDIRTDADHEQAQNWLASYFERVAERHGVEALDKFGSLLPKAKEALKKGEKSVKERLRERVEENQQATSGARPRASGREGERIQGSDDGRSANGAQKVRPRSADEPFESSAPVKGPQIPISEQTNTANVRQPGEKAPEFQSVKGARVQPKMFSEGEPSDEWAEPLDEDSIKQETLFGKDGQPRRSWRDVWDITSDIVNIPKALRASQDLSAMFRQGFYMGVPHPVKFGKSAVRQVKSLRKSEYKKFYQWLRRHPAYQDALAAGLEFSSDGKMTVNEENFGTRFAGKIPGIAMAERAFVTFLDSMRIELFDLYRKSLKKQIPNLAEQFEGMQASAEWINKTSGRAHFGKGRFGSWMKETGIPFLNFFGWSPRYVYSRMQMLNPATYLKNLKNPQRRVVFARQMTELFSTSAVLVATGALAKAAGATISFDPDDPDFLKLRFGTTRYDVLAGLQQSARLAIQIGKWVRSRGEENDKKRRNVSQETVKDTLRFARTKLAPVPGFFVDWLNDWVKVTGEQHKPGQFWGKMKNGEWAQSAAEAVNDPVLSLGLSLMFSTAVEAWVKGYKGGTLYGDESDALKGLIKVGQIVPFEFVGFGVQDYDRPEWKKRTRELFEQFDLDPGFPKRKPEETEPAYQKRVRAHIAEQESAVESFAGDTNLIGQPLERQKTLLKQEMSDDGRERMAKLRPEDIADDRMVRAWIQVGLERLKANPMFQQMSESEQKHAIQSYYGRMNTYKAQPKNKMHGYQRPEVVDETIIQRKIKEAIKAQQGN